jgi:hypothetical protein
LEILNLEEANIYNYEKEGIDWRYLDNYFDVFLRQRFVYSDWFLDREIKVYKQLTNYIVGKGDVFPRYKSKLKDFLINNWLS